MPEAPTTPILTNDEWYDWTEDHDDCWLDQYLEAKEVALDDLQPTTA